MKINSSLNSPLNILVAEDSPADRLILQAILQRLGHRVITAEDGLEAIESFKTHRPDLVFLDVIMPVLGGVDAAREIKALAGEALVPVVFLTSLADAESLAICLNAGGDDFLSKPYNRIILESKIKAFARMIDMQKTMVAQRDQLQIHHKHFLQEQKVAKQVFDKIAHSGALKLDNIRYFMSAMAIFNGDILLADISPWGSLLVILGDFTGHGLPAAIGSMPLASTFYGMSGKGFTLVEILREINHKLNQTLPVGLFCCATAVEFDFNRNKISVWNGGLPDNVVYRRASRTFERVHSKHLPLGVLKSDDFNATMQIFDFADGDQYFMWTDGIQEARNHLGEMLGDIRINAILQAGYEVDQIYNLLVHCVQEHTQSSTADDDVSLVNIAMPSPQQMRHFVPKAGARNGYLSDWALSLTLVASSLKTFNPLLLMMHVVSEVPGLRQHSSVLFNIFSELYNNALEHGVLGLNSNIKSSPQGFLDYYRERKERLDNLEDGNIKFDIAHKMLSTGGCLTVRVTDSGAGFIWSPQQGVDAAKSVQYFGRGLKLVTSLCQRFTVIEPGNCTEADFVWQLEHT